MRTLHETNKAKHMTKRNKELREIYLLAAEEATRYYDGCFACCLISEAARELFNQPQYCEARKLFTHLYDPNPAGTGICFWYPVDFTPAEQKENRILALLFMAELARTDSLPTLEEIQPA